MLNIFKKGKEESKKEIGNKEVKNKETSKNPEEKRDLSHLKEQKIKYREEKQKKKEQNRIKRLEEEKIQAQKIKEAEAKRQEEIKAEQAKKQEEFQKRQAENLEKAKSSDSKKEYEKEEEKFDLFGYEILDLKQGMIIEGTVIALGNDEHIVEVTGGYQEVLFPKQEVVGEVQVGDEVKALIYRHSNDDFYISQRRLKNVEVINKIKEMQENKETVKGKVLDFKNSNYIVELENGYQGLVYQINIALEYIEDHASQIGKEYDFLIKKVLPRGNFKFELTRIPLLKKALEEKVDLVSEDVIIKVQEFTKNKAGIEFDYEGFRVFIPYKLLSYSFVDSNSDLSSFIGKDAKIIECKKTKFGYNVVASVKALEQDPFESYIKDHNEGDEITGEVIKKERYGLFIKLADNVRGLYHRNNFSTELAASIDDVKVGDQITAKIKTIDEEKKQIDLETL